MEHQKQIVEFISKTGADTSIAKSVLEEHNWDVANAVKSYKLVHTAALPPVGPRKNLDPVPQASAGGGSPGQIHVDMRSVSPSSTLERRLKRGLSKTTENLPLVNKARESVLQDITETTEHDKNALQHFVDTPEYTFILPDLTRFSEDFRAFLHKALIEMSTLVSLEQAGRLNWWADLGTCSRLLPLATTGDGNCLLHAASLGMWGFHDRELTLRRALYNALGSGVVKGSFWRRWRWQQTQMNKQSGLILSETEWQTEWSNMLKLASTTPRTNPGSQKSCCDSPATMGLMERPEKDVPKDSEVFYESLEEFHVFVLAHVLRRSIIVVADTILKNPDGEALAPIPFGGIYLPLQCAPADCHRSPLLLTYDAAHFSALVPMEEDKDDVTITTGVKSTAVIPVVDPELELLPIHFLVDPGEDYTWGKDSPKQNLEMSTDDKLASVQQYLDLIKVPIPVSSLCGAGDAGSDSSDSSRPRSNSWSGPKASLNRSMSLESTESNNTLNNSSGSSTNMISINNAANTGSSNNIINSSGSINNAANNSNGNKTKPPKDKKKDKERLKSAKQMQSVVKSFGSLGKTMSKKLKNLGGLKAMNKMESDDKKAGKYVRKSSIGTVTQSTKTSSSLTAELLRDKQHVLCARLLHKRLEYQDKMVENYLQSAWQNFEQDRVIRKQQDAEMKTLAKRRQEPDVNCINIGCEGIGTQSTSYLCSTCYDKQRKEALDREKSPGVAPLAVSDDLGPPSVNPASQTNQKQSSESYQRTSGDFKRQNTLVNIGTSKFYTYADEDQSLPVPKYLDQTSNNILRKPDDSLNNYAAARHSKVDKAPLELSRSSFYDQSLTAPTQSRPKSINNLPPDGGTVIINNLQNEAVSRLAEVTAELSHKQHKNVAMQSVGAHCGRQESYTKAVGSNPITDGPHLNAYAPKVSNTQHQEQSSYQQDPGGPSRVLVQGGGGLKTQGEGARGREGQYVSRIQVGGESCNPQPIQQHKCRNQQCSNLSKEGQDFYCDQCYKLYDRDRTTFL